jgi:membrane protein YqaA with SNARE-associated domain
MQPPSAAIDTQSPAPTSWYRRLYARVEALSASRHATSAMMAVSVVDGSFFPVPPFALLVPMVLARPHKWVRYAVLGTLASILGGLIGYWLGTLVADGAINFLHIDLNVRITRFGVDATLGELLGRNFWALALLCSILPTPLKVVAIASGLVGVALPQFFIAVCIGRTVRFFLVAGVMRFAGPPARRWLRV